MSSADIYTPNTQPFRPTFLYIKQHSVTGMLYFGKTVCNPETYIGSGTRWLRHIQKHGKEHVVNLWYCLFCDEADITEFALDFSVTQCIVESDGWANLKPENGTWGGGTPGVKRSDAHKARLSELKTGVPFSETHKANLCIAAQKRIHKPMTAEAKAKLSAAKKGKPVPRMIGETNPMQNPESIKRMLETRARNKMLRAQTSSS